MQVKARNQNSNCAMCCNPTPTEVYKHLPGFVKLLCQDDIKLTNLLISLSTSAGVRGLVSDETGTGVLVFNTSPTLVTPVLGAATASSVTLTKTNAIQSTSTTTGVTVNGSAGVISTFTSTLAAGAAVTFTVSNSAVTANSVILLTEDDSAITSGTASIRIGTVSNGSFVIKVMNTHATQALNNILKIHYLVV